MSEEAQFPKHLVGYMSSIIDGMQVLNAQIGRNIETSARFETELFKINRQYNTLTEMVLKFQAETRQGLASLRLGWMLFCVVWMRLRASVMTTLPSSKNYGLRATGSTMRF